MKTPGQAATQLSRQVSFKNKTLQLALLASFVLAVALLVTSHHAVTTSSASNADKQLLSVPLPRRRHQAANGGLPPIPDSVRDKLSNDQHDEKYLLYAMGKFDGGKDEVVSTISFPLPYDAVPVESVPSEIILQPTFGSHRRQKNAVFAFAEGYELNVYVTFIESLKNTGFRGDVILSVSHVDVMKSGVEEYLKWYSLQSDDSLRVISYGLSWECYKKSGARILPTNKEGRGSTTNHGFSDCKIHGLYSDGKDNYLAPAADPREARPVATARYELYWIWSRQYDESSSILIIDVRDSYFQSNPFNFVPFSLGSVHLPANQGTKEGCSLDLFEENFEALNIGTSNYNSQWIKSAYGQESLKKMTLKPVICSGSTMGSQRAIELYCRAMVAQFDNTKCKAVGCDQGFHNYLFYEGGLKSFLASHDCAINVHRQGSGAVNSLAAMRKSSLRSQGVLKSLDSKANGSDADNSVVLNNDNTTLSPVVHQFDRDKELKGIIRKRSSAMLTRWKSNQS
mmetsp:Transcript_22586/g.54569  ORF Transcript_22586/g.54569 Transcript_22586/m.54569 type:complete len:511 (+) Transcript_22586:221-1753(+)